MDKVPRIEILNSNNKDIERMHFRIFKLKDGTLQGGWIKKK